MNKYKTNAYSTTRCNGSSHIWEHGISCNAALIVKVPRHLQVTKMAPVYPPAESKKEYHDFNILLAQPLRIEKGSRCMLRYTYAFLITLMAFLLL